MTTPSQCGYDCCCEEGRPVFRGGGDELAVQLPEPAFGLLLTTAEWVRLGWGRSPA
jgi:hypothetical protein